ncbi:MAG: tRNA (adenosine(37)-N6)-threonylcarbamoyltransferase complex ATPase subunit type 1 TsaE [Gemmatimonadota bacterium]
MERERVKRVDLEGQLDLETGGLTEADMVAWGRWIGEAAVAGDVGLPLVLALRGELGAGKSVLARAVARGAGVGSSMPSPTFNLVFRYTGAAGVEVYHVDLYRLEHPDEVWELGWRDLGSGRQIVLMEWPERAASLLPADRWDLWLTDASEADVVAGAGTGDLRWVRGARRGHVSDIPKPEG